MNSSCSIQDHKKYVTSCWFYFDHTRCFCCFFPVLELKYSWFSISFFSVLSIIVSILLRNQFFFFMLYHCPDLFLLYAIDFSLYTFLKHFSRMWTKFFSDVCRSVLISGIVTYSIIANKNFLEGKYIRQLFDFFPFSLILTHQIPGQ